MLLPTGSKSQNSHRLKSALGKCEFARSFYPVIIDNEGRIFWFSFVSSCLFSFCSWTHATPSQPIIFLVCLLQMASEREGGASSSGSEQTAGTGEEEEKKKEEN